MKVFKYRIFPGANEISLPVGSKILTVHEQHGGMYIWALVDDSCDEMVMHNIYVAATGESIDAAMFLGSIFMEGGRFVFHAFELDSYVEERS